MDDEGEGRIKESVFCTVLKQTLSLTMEQCSAIYRRLDKAQRGYVTFSKY